MTVTPQALGALIKRTGIKKSETRRGTSYRYHTEGYELTRQHGKNYAFNYYRRLTLALPSEAESEAYYQRMHEAFSLVSRALTAAEISHYTDGGVIWISLEEEK